MKSKPQKPPRESKDSRSKDKIPRFTSQINNKETSGKQPPPARELRELK